MSAAFGIEVPLGPFEIGPVRFKFGLSADATLAARADPTVPVALSLGGRRSVTPGHDRVHGGRTTEQGRSIAAGVDVAISQNITVGASAELSGDALDRLIANPSPETLASTLTRSFNAHVQFGSNLTVDLQQDSDLCFLGVRAQFTPAAFGSASAEVTGTVAGAIRMGPSRRLMQQLALRSGGAITGLVGRALPRVVPVGGLAASEFFATWATPIGWAVPISLGIRDALVAATGAARARGEDRGNCNQFAAAFVRESYGFSHPAYSGSNRAPAQRGIAGARALAARHGWVQVQRRLERDFNSGLPPRSSISQAGYFLASDLEVMWSRMGEAIFASHEGAEMPRAMQRF